MALQVHQVNNFDQLIRQLIKAGEGLRGLPYAVNAGSPTGDHTITIGYGYTMVQNGRLGWQRYSNLNNDLIAIGITPQLPADMETEITAVSNALNEGRYADADAAVSRFSSLWAQNFGALSQPQADTLFGRAAQTKLDEIKNRFKQVLGSTNGTTLYNSLVNTSEMAALLSRAYTGIATIRQDLVKALSVGNRAEAWFVMRYRLTTTSSVNFNGAAARQYAESQVFGLYNDPSNVQADEATDVYRMFQRNRDVIFKHESLYGEGFDGEDGTRNLIDEDNAPKSKYRTLLNTYGDVETIIESLNPAKTAIFTYLNGRSDIPDAVKAKLTDENILSTSIYLNPSKATDYDRMSLLDATSYEAGNTGSNDLMIGMDQVDWLFGGKGNDILIGEAGVDLLEGGEDNDTLLGGDGNDTYVINAGDGIDTIEDKQGKNTIIFCGRELNFFHLAGAYYVNCDGTLKAVMDGSELVVTPFNSTDQKLILNDNFQWGDFGINLIDEPTNPNISNVINLNTEDPSHVNHQFQAPGWGASSDDSIVGGSGHDVFGNNDAGGTDWLVGGSGNDVINSWGTGDDILEGDAGVDVLIGGVGGTGDNEIYCEFTDYDGDGAIDTMSQFIANGEIAPNLNTTGDIATGGDGDDFIYGSDAKDALLGGDGYDLLVGGGGDDIILGDATLSHVDLAGIDSGAYDDPGYSEDFWNWSYSVTVTPSGNTNIYTYTFSNVFVNIDDTGTVGSDDVIYAGTGNDIVDGGGGDDEIYGGTGNDTLFGSGGYDFIEGGDGDDAIKGDAYCVPVESQVGDYIDGGAGNDILWGNGGNDDIFGGADNDTLYGDEGDDYLDGEAGMDSLYGSTGNDVMFGGDGNDYIEGDDIDFAGDDYIDGGAGDDTLIGAGGADTIYGGDGDDELAGDATNVALADQGDDYIDGEGGNNWIAGNGGNDTLAAADGNNTLFGGEGDDELFAGSGNDTIFGGKIILFRRKTKLQNTWRRIERQEDIRRIAA